MDRIIFTSMVAAVVVIAAVGWMYLIFNSHVYTASSVRPEEADNNNTNFLKEMENAPKDRYLKSYITINGFELTANLALTNEQKEKGLSGKDELKESEAMLFVFKESAKH